MAEVENIAPGLSRELLAELPAGEYEATCKPGMVGDGIRQTLTVTGRPAALSDDESLAQAGADYQRYVQSQTAALLEQTTAFVTAVKAGDIAGAKALYPVARTYWERIEPVAESFGDLDPLIDGREGDQEPGQDFTGFHRIEKALWETGDVSDMGPLRRPAARERAGDRRAVQRGHARAAAAGQRRQGAARRDRHGQDHRRGGPVLAHRPLGLRRQPRGFEGRRPGAAALPARRTTPTWSPRSTSGSPPPRPSSARTAPATAGCSTTSSTRPSCTPSATASPR